MPTIELIENKAFVPKEFNRVAKRYDFATQLSHGYQYDLNVSAGRMKLNGHERVLDLCCGTGKSTAACLQYLPNGSVVGLDNSEGMLAEAQEKYDAEIKSGKVKFMLNDAMLLPFADESFDAVFVAYGLRNMPDYKKFIEGVHRVLKPGGKICIHDYSLNENWFSKVYWAVLSYGFIVPFCTILSGSSRIYTYLAKSVLTFLSPKQIVDLLHANGFEQAVAMPHEMWRKPISHSVIAVKKY